MFRALKQTSFSLGRNLSLGHSQRRTLYQVPLKDMRFLINDVYDFEKHYKTLTHCNGESAPPDTVDMLLEEMAKFAEQELAPIDTGADSVGCKQTGPNTVTTPPGFKEAYKNFVDGGWQGLSFPEEYGGQGLPSSLSLLQAEMSSTASWTWTMFPGLSKGAINTLINHGSVELKEKYLEKLISGEYTGTMCLTEPQCGSDLAQVKTKAELDPSTGKYKVSGTKIFISCGEHDMTDNIIHCVLARTPNAPPGTKGISLFAVPKKLSDGTLNRATVGRIEEKMGCHGSPTCEMIFDQSEGELIGTLNKGLNHMFTFINTSRLGTAIQGLAACEKSFQNSIAYARERKAMHSLQKNLKSIDPTNPDLIIVHPAVRSMLLKQKAFAEGARSMIFECSVLEDKKQNGLLKGSDGAKEAKAAEDEMGFLTPILKGFLTEIASESAYIGIQVFGGHGYINSNGQEQIARDVRISSVWEGTTQIQALDLLGRKVMLNKLKPLFSFANSLLKLSLNSKEASFKRRGQLALAALSLQVEVSKVAMKASRDKNYVGVASEPFLMTCGYVQMAAHWLRMEQKAQEKIKKGGLSDADKSFLDAKIKTSEFYFEAILPRIKSLKAEMNLNEKIVMGMTPEQFTA